MTANKAPRQSDRAFGITFAVVFSIITAVTQFFFDSHQMVTPSLAVAFLALALMAPGVLMPLNRLWAAFAERLGRVNNFLLLALFFFLLIFPLGFIIRLFGRDFMCRRQDSSATTYWTPVKRHTNADTLQDMF